MSRLRLLLALLAAGALCATVANADPRPRAWTPPAGAAVATELDADPDLPTGLGEPLDKAEFFRLRDAAMLLRFDAAPLDEAIAARVRAVELLQRQKSGLGPFVAAGFWTAIGPWPIPNGQTTSFSASVTGRVTAIAVHPSNASTVYVGTAQGGVYRSLDGGSTWVPIFDSAASLAIGSLALAPSNPTILYVGTGEANLSADSFFGVGLYRVDNADTAPVLNGPFNPTPTTDVIGAKTFTGRSIAKILVKSDDPGTIFVATASGIGGLNAEAFGSSPPITALRGLYRSTDATSGSPSFAKLTVSNASSIAPDVTGNQICTDIAFDPTDATSNTLLAWLYPAAATTGGVFRTTNALAAPASVVFTQTFSPGATGIRGTFAITQAGGPTTVLVATGEAATGTSCTSGSGVIRRSTDGGLTWSGKLAGGGGFCGGQCWYDQPIAVSPIDANLILIGGAGNGTCSRVFSRSTDGGATFSGAGVADVGMHADAHAIVFAPSDPTIVYEGNDGGVWKSTNSGASFTSLNSYPFSATQFQSIDVHPIDPNFSIGGTQDNGTNWYQPAATWNRIDWGDGGFAVIDQNAADNTNVTMYHTYFNQRNNLVGYARVFNTASAFDGNWGFVGNNGNNIGVLENPNFYAPLVRGPGSPNSIYYATDRLHRSTDNGATNPVVSQAPIMTSGGLGVPISAVGIAPTNDNVRLVGLNNATIWGTTTGSSVLTNMTGGGMPAHTIGRIVIDPTNPNVAYVCYGGFNLAAGTHVWKTTNLMSGTPTWVAAGNGLPDVPANAMAIDPVTPSRLFVGTDVGVWTSNDGGANWAPYTTGMPVVSVFDMKLQPTARILRVATHGRGMFERLIDTPVATQVSLVGAEIVDGHPRMTWYSADGVGQQLNVYRRPEPGDWEVAAQVYADGSGQLVYEDGAAVAGRSYEYAIGIQVNGGERRAGNVWVDVPLAATFALRAASTQGSGPLRFHVSVASAAPATLELLDLAGRRVTSLALGSHASGEFDVTMDAASARPGVYWARLSQAGRMVSTRLAIVR